jgi:hypothetical protein
MAMLRVYKRNSTFIDLSDLAEEMSPLGLVDALLKYYNKRFEKEAKKHIAHSGVQKMLYYSCSLL